MEGLCLTEPTPKSTPSTLTLKCNMKSNQNFSSTICRFYRLKQKRQLGNLFTNDVTKGCTKDDPGIGDGKYVKDVHTGSVSTTNFECSIFGPHTHPSLGWVRFSYRVQKLILYE
jgi:hypothetical protein